MATPAGALFIEMSANVARLSKDMSEARSVVAGTTAKIESAVASAKAALASLGLGIGLSQVIALADSYTKFTAQLKLASSGNREYAQSLDDVRRIATLAQAELQGTGVLYARIKNATAELGLSQQKVANITETVTLALKASGATTAESASAMLQLSQAFGSGVLRGQEFNAVNEAAPRLMKALADGIGVPVGQLRAMAEAGKITSEVMAGALPRALEDLRKEAAQVQTIGGAFTVLKNSVMEYAGATVQANGSVAVMTGALTALANNLQLVINLLLTMTAVKFANWLTAGVAGLYAQVTASQAAAAATLAKAQANVTATTTEIALTTARMAELRASVLATEGTVALAIVTNGLIPMQARAAVAAEAHAVALVGLAAAQRGASVAISAGSAVMGILGGPIGLIITALGVAATAWAFFGKSAEDANKQVLVSTKDSAIEIMAALDKQNEKLRERLMLSKGLGEIAKQDSPQTDALADAARTMTALLAKQNELKAAGARLNRDDQVALFAAQFAYERIAFQLQTGLGLKKEIEKVGQLPVLAEWMKKYATNTEKLALELEKARIEFNGMIPPEVEKRIRESFSAKAVKDFAKEAEKAAKEIAEHNERMRTLDAKGWVAYIEAKNKADDDFLLAEVRRLDELAAHNKRMQTLDAAGWVAYIEAKKKADDEFLVNQAKGHDDANKKLRDGQINLTRDLIAAWRNAGAGIAESLTKAFGAGGAAMGGMVRAYTDAIAQQIAIDENYKQQRAVAGADIAKLAKQQQDESLQNSLTMYGDMAGAAASFFDKQSTAYKVLHGIEQAMFAAKLAMQVAEIAGNMSVGASGVASSVMQQAADGVLLLFKIALGIANQANGDPYSAFARMAAMAGIMAGVAAIAGVSGSFGGGSSGQSASERQAQQGTGTVLGDSTAKSESLLASIKMIEKTDGLGLIVSHAMLAALQAIQNSMGALASLIFRTGGITSDNDFGATLGTVGGSAGGGLGGVVGANNEILARGFITDFDPLFAALFNWANKTTTELLDSGIRITGTLNNLQMMQYGLIRTTSSFLGMFEDSEDHPVERALPDNINAQFNLIFKAIGDSIEAAAKALDLWTPNFVADMGNIVLAIGDMSLKDLKGQELQDALNDIFSTASDQLAETMLPGFAIFQQVGEGYFQTVMRVATANEFVKQTFTALGWSMPLVGMAAITARMSLVDLAGGIEKFGKLTQDYYSKYYSAAEQHAMSGAALGTEFAAAGVAMPTDTAGMRAAIEAASKDTSAAGQALLITLLKLAPAFFDFATQVVGLDGKLHSLDDVTAQHISLTEALAIATGEITAREIDNEHRRAEAIDAASLALINATIKAEDLQTAARALADALAVAAAQAKETAGWQTQLDILQGRTTQQSVDRANQWAAATSEASRALMVLVFAEQDLTAAAQVAAAAAQAAAAATQAAAAAEAARTRETENLQDRLDVLMGKRTQQDLDRANAWTAATSEASRALLVEIFRQEDLAAAALAAANAITAIIASTGTFSAGQGQPGQIWISTGGNFGYWAWPPGYVHPAAPGTGPSAADILSQKLALLAQIYELTGDKVAALAILEQQHAIALAALDPSLRALQTELWGLQAAAAAAAEAARLAAEQQAKAKQYTDWLGQNALGELSPLTGQQRLVEAQRQFDLLKAQGGAVDAGALTRAADALLAADRAVEGFGGGYSALYASTRAYIDGLAQQVLQPSAGEAAIVSNVVQLRTEVADMKVVVARLLERLLEATSDGHSDVADAVTTGSARQAAATTTAATIGRKR